MTTADNMTREGALSQLIDIISARGSNQRLVALLRHSVRVEITGLTVEDAVNAPLTEVGRKLATDFGRRLPPERPLRLFHSEVPRCCDTAERIAAGFEEVGGTVESMGTKPMLAAAFIRDPMSVAREFGMRGPRGFVKAWLDGELDEQILDSPKRAAMDQLTSMLEELAVVEDLQSPALDLHISHDVNVIALLHLMADIGDLGLPWPGYLEGVVVEAGSGTPHMAWYHDRTGKIRAAS